MPIPDPKIKDRPNTDPELPPKTGPSNPVEEPKKEPKIEDPRKRKPTKK